MRLVCDSSMDTSEMLPPELERFWRTDDGLTAVQRAEAYGIDISRLEENLSMTPSERLKRNDWVLSEAEALTGKYLEACDSLGLREEDVLVLLLDSLITAKRAMGRPRDLHAVLELEAIREKLRKA